MTRRAGGSPSDANNLYGDRSQDNAEECDPARLTSCGGPVLLYLPSHSPWLDPLEMLGRRFRREVTPCELVESMQARLRATSEFFARHDRTPARVHSLTGVHPA